MSSFAKVSLLLNFLELLYYTQFAVWGGPRGGALWALLLAGYFVPSLGAAGWGTDLLTPIVDDTSEID